MKLRTKHNTLFWRITIVYKIKKAIFYSKPQSLITKIRITQRLSLKHEAKFGGKLSNRRGSKLYTPRRTLIFRFRQLTEYCYLSTVRINAFTKH